MFFIRADAVHRVTPRGGQEEPSGAAARAQASESRLPVLVTAISVLDVVIVVAAVLVILLPLRHDLSPGTRLTAIALVIALTLPGLAVVHLLARPIRHCRDVRASQQLVRQLLARRAVTTAFQPIFACGGEVVLGVEGLSRFEIESMPTPDLVFAAAQEAGLGVELELLAVQTALARAVLLPAHLYISLNVSPLTLAHPGLLPLLVDGPIPPGRLVVELTEHESIVDYEPLVRARDELRRRHIRLAVDDAGAGYASFRHILHLSPDLIKIDRDLVSGVDHSPKQRAFVKAVVGFGQDCQAHIVAEGVETAAERQALVAMNVEAVQGFLTGRPTSDPDHWASWEPRPDRNRQAELSLTSAGTRSRRDNGVRPTPEAPWTFEPNTPPRRGS
jgi:EAL domain-containing protein (putative c-di-GMP-specific phosphodiesterase class I)